MFKFKRITSLLLAIFLLVSVSACGSDTSKSDSGSSSTPAPAKTDTTTTDTTTDTTTETTDTADASGTSYTGEKVKITFATWQNIVEQYEVAERFNAKNPNIEMVVDDFGGWYGEGSLLERVASGNFPDIFMVANVDMTLQNKWYTNLKPYLDANPQMQINKAAIEGCTFDNDVFMMPVFLFTRYVIVNKTLLNQMNIPMPDPDWTLDDLMTIAEKATSGQNLGLSEAMSWLQHAPAMKNPEISWAAWNPSTQKYQLDSNWEYAVNYTKKLIDKKLTWDSLEFGLETPWTYDEGTADRDAAQAAWDQAKIDKVGTSDWTAFFNQGGFATVADFSWGMNFAKSESFGGWEYEFYATPVGEKGMAKRAGLVVDAMAISSTCKAPDAAFEFIKYMASAEGYSDLVDIAEKYDQESMMAKYPDIEPGRIPETLSVGHLPATTDRAAFDTMIKVNNLDPTFNRVIDALLSDAYLDGYKVVPGFNGAYYGIIDKGIKEQIYQGQKSAADVGPELERLANEYTDNVFKAIRGE